MSDQWYFVQEGQRKGPVAEKQLKQLATTGQLKPTDLVWKRGMATWTPAAEVAEVFDEPPPLPAQEPNWPTDPNGTPWPVGYDGQPVDPECYSPQWQYIKRFLVEHGLGYMIDTQEKRNKLAKDFGFLVGLGEGYLATELLKTFFHFVERRK